MTTSIPLTGADLARARAAQALKRAEAAKAAPASQAAARGAQPAAGYGSKPPSVGTAVPVPVSSLSAAQRQKLAQAETAAQPASGPRTPAPARSQGRRP